jgi:peptidyl-prolyl cis-trans isomerase D
MIQLFRKFFSSKVGLGVSLVFLALIAFAFASSDLANTSMFGGVSGGDRVAVVGNERVDASELSAAAANAMDQARQTDPTVTMQAFIARGGLEEVLEQLLQRTALAVFAERHGMRVSDRLVDSELLQIPAFRGADGNFNAEAFRAVIGQRGLTEASVRADLATGLLARQLLTPLTFSPVVPRSLVQQYASLLRERRQGSIASLPSSAFAPTGNPSDTQLQAFFTENRERYIRPERRTIRYASFGEDAVGQVAAPTADQIAQRYQRDRALYSATERRRLTQLVAPTQDAARAIVAEVAGGKALEAAAREKGLATTAIGPVTKTELAGTASAAVADAAFTAADKAMATPARGGLGWYVLRVDAIERQAGRSLEQVRPEIAATLAAEQRRAALADLTARLEQEFEEGRSLAEVAQELGLQVSSTAPATADGSIYGRPAGRVPELLTRVLPVAFEMEESEPQLAEVVPGETFLLFDVAEVTRSAVAPLSEIRQQVIADWRLGQGAKAARAAADRILARVARGSTLAAAVAAERTTVPAPQNVNLNREQIAQAAQIPPSMALFFSMAAGTVKKLEAPADAGWYVVQLNSIEAGQVPANDPILAATLRQLGQVNSDEYVEQFVKAAQREIGVERNAEAINAVAAQLTGQTAE